MQSVENLVFHPVKSIDDLEFLQLVCGALVMSGVAMEVAGSSRPASGSEHLISHAYDQIADRPRMHGEQVGVATIATPWLQENPHHSTVRRVLDGTGFSAAMKRDPLPGYYTVLSEPGAVDKLERYLTEDPLWGDYLA